MQYDRVVYLIIVDGGIIDIRHNTNTRHAHYMPRSMDSVASTANWNIEMFRHIFSTHTRTHDPVACVHLALWRRGSHSVRTYTPNCVYPAAERLSLNLPLNLAYAVFFGHAHVAPCSILCCSGICLHHLFGIHHRVACAIVCLYVCVFVLSHTINKPYLYHFFIDYHFIVDIVINYTDRMPGLALAPLLKPVCPFRACVCVCARRIYILLSMWRGLMHAKQCECQLETCVRSARSNCANWLGTPTCRTTKKCRSRLALYAHSHNDTHSTEHAFLQSALFVRPLLPFASFFPPIHSAAAGAHRRQSAKANAKQFSISDNLCCC